jgi:glyoxalase family protein
MQIMLKEIEGLHHITSMASDANQNNRFFTQVLGLRRIKKTVNFDAPDVYHLYYGDETGTPGSVMTYFPFPNMGKGNYGVGEVGTTTFSVPVGSLKFWQQRFEKLNIQNVELETRFGENRLGFTGPDGDGFALVEIEADDRSPWVSDNVPDDVAIRGFHSAGMRLSDHGPMTELLCFMNYEIVDEKNNIRRLKVINGNQASVIDLEKHASAPRAQQGAGSVHHIAFSVANREAQLEVRKALMDTGYQVTPVIDRDYFWAIYFRTPDGILFEIATNEPGFERDEPAASLGKALKLPSQHEHLRETLEKHLQPLED